MVTSVSGEVGQMTHFSYGDNGLPDLLEYLSGLDLGTGVHILEATVSSGRINPLVKVVVDTVQGVTIDELARISRQLRDDDLLSAHLGVSDCRVEVSSPGVSYGLRQPWQFSRHVGRQVAIRIQSPDEVPSGPGPLAKPTQAVPGTGRPGETGSPSKIEGELIEAGPDGILLEVAGVREQVAWKHIQKATVQLAW